MAGPTGARATHITTNATTLCKSGSGILHRLIVNTVGAAANTATVFDSLTGSGDVIAVIGTVTPSGNVYEFNVAVRIGVTVVTATGTAADLTVVTD